MLGQLLVLRRGGAAEMVEAEAEALRDLRLHLVHLGAVLSATGWPAFAAASSAGGAMFVGGAEEEHLVAAPPLVAGEEVGGQLAADEGCPGA